MEIDQMKHRHFLLYEKKNPLIIELDKEFGQYYWDNNFIYKPNQKDLEKIFKIVNKHVFSNRLPPIKIQLKTTNDDGIYGAFCDSVRDDETGERVKLSEPFISITDWGTDNFTNVLDVLCHEMIHYYDTLYGPIRKYREEKLVNFNGKQFLGSYDAHGDYFNSWVNRFAMLEIAVSIHAKKKNRYYLNRAEVMKDSETPTDKKSGTNTSVLARNVKAYFDSIESEEFLGVEIKDGVAYIVME